MRHLISIFVIALFSAYSNASWGEVPSNRLYVSKDQHGNMVFTDRQPKLGEYETKLQPLISTVTWVKSEIQPKLNSTNKTKKKHSKAKSNKFTKKQSCQKLLDELSTLEKQLEYKQKASQFDSFKKKLRAARWQYQTKC